MATWKDAHDALAGKLAETEKELAEKEAKLKTAVEALKRIAKETYDIYRAQDAIVALREIAAIDAKGGRVTLIEPAHRMVSIEEITAAIRREFLKD